jgi:hypothetical protein
MKFSKYIGYGALTFSTGLLIMFFLVGIFSQPGGGEISSDIFNSGIMALVATILFLCATIVICTLLLVNAIKSNR